MTLIDRAQSQLLVVDVQERLAAAIPERDEIVRQCQILLQGANALRVPIVVSEQYPRGLGRTVGLLQELTDAGQRFEKLEFSCLRNAALADRIEGNDRQQLVIVGLEAHICVLQTAIEAVERGYNVFVVADAVGSRRVMSKDFALGRIAATGGRVVTAEMVIFEWLGTAAAAEFKSLSALVR